MVIATPIAAAAAITGAFVGEGDTTLSGAWGGSMHSHALFLADSSRTRSLELLVPNLSVCEYWVEYVAVNVGPGVDQTPPPHQRCHSRTDATVTLTQGVHDGWLGIHAGAGTLVALNGALSTVESRGPGGIGFPQGSSLAGASRDSPDKSNFNHTLPAHLFMRSSSVEFRGGGQLKLLGPDVRIASAQNVTSYETKDRAEDSGPVSRGEIRWLVLEFTDAVLTLRSDVPIEIAGARMEASVDGAVSFVAREGQAMVGDAAVVASRGDPVVLDGRLTAELEPGASSSPRLHVRVFGDARAVSIGSARLAAPESSSSSGEWRPWAFMPILVGIAIGAGVAWERRRRPRAPPTLVPPKPSPAQVWADWIAPTAAWRKNPVSLAERAEIAADEGDFLRAVELLEAARKADPNRPEYILPLGMYLLKVGRIHAALKAFDESTYHETTGEPERLAALCAARIGDHEKTEYYILRAIERATRIGLVHEIAEDPEFAPFLTTPTVKDALEQALGPAQ